MELEPLLKVPTVHQLRGNSKHLAWSILTFPCPEPGLKSSPWSCIQARKAYTEETQEEEGKSLHPEKATRNRNRDCHLQFTSGPLHWMEKRPPFKAYVSPAVVGHQEPTYSNVASTRHGKDAALRSGADWATLSHLRFFHAGFPETETPRPGTMHLSRELGLVTA